MHPTLHGHAPPDRDDPDLGEIGGNRHSRDQRPFVWDAIPEHPESGKQGQSLLNDIERRQACGLPPLRVS